MHENGYQHVSPFSGKTYTLYSRVITLNGGRQHRIYYFSPMGKKPKSGDPCAVPGHCEVVVNKRTDLPVLRRKQE